MHADKIQTNVLGFIGVHRRLIELPLRLAGGASDQIQLLSSIHDTGPAPRFRRVPEVARNEVVGFGRGGALQKHIVVRIQARPHGLHVSHLECVIA